MSEVWALTDRNAYGKLEKSHVERYLDARNKSCSNENY